MKTKFLHLLMLKVVVIEGSLQGRIFQRQTFTKFQFYVTPINNTYLLDMV